MVWKAALLACLLWVGPVLGQGQDDGLTTSVALRSWSVAPEVSHYRYREPGTMTNEGTLYGVVTSYTFNTRDDGPVTAWFDIDGNDILRFEGRLSFGEVDYEGSYMDSGEPLSIGGNDDLLIDLRLLWGRPLPRAGFLDAVHAGLAYRYLNDDSSSHPSGYQRQSNYLYVPLGSRKDFAVTRRWALSLTGEFDLLIIGRQISRLSEVDPSLPDVRNWQWPGFGLGLSAEVRHMSRDVDLGIAPFLRYWWIAESSIDQGYYEPENNTFEYGLSFIVRF